jgi:hypothetical protein
MRCEPVTGSSPEDDSRVLSPRHRARLERRILEVATGFWGRVVDQPPAAIEGAAAEFFACYPQRPVADNSGGSGYSDCFWLYTAARLLAPRVIVESGVAKGQTTWLLRQACPDAQLYAVDADLGQRVYQDASVRYHEGDWTELDFEGADLRQSLCFFDDHVDQARRVREAHARGCRTLLFDDDLPAETLYATGAPPVPTISMVFDDALEPGERIQWLRRGRLREYVVDPARVAGVRALIRSHHTTPDLTAIVRQRVQGGLTLVQLVD